MSEVGSSVENSPRRADAQRNRRRLLDAATRLILEIGGEPSRDAVAQRAGVGIGTLYRHFPDRQTLLRAVALDVLDRTIEQGRIALAESATGGAALRRYLHAAIDTGLGAVNIIHPLLDDRRWPDRRSEAQHMLDRLIRTARRDGEIAADVTAADVVFATIRFCRPLAVGLSAAEEDAIAHRQLDRYLDGLMTRVNQPTYRGPSSDRSMRASPNDRVNQAELASGSRRFTQR